MMDTLLSHEATGDDELTLECHMIMTTWRT